MAFCFLLFPSTQKTHHQKGKTQQWGKRQNTLRFECGSLGRALFRKANVHRFYAWVECLGWGFSPWWGQGTYERHPIDVSLSHQWFSPFLSPSLLSPSLSPKKPKKNNNNHTHIQIWNRINLEKWRNHLFTNSVVVIISSRGTIAHQNAYSYAWVHSILEKRLKVVIIRIM